MASLETLPIDASFPGLFNIALQERQLLGHAWSDATAHHSVLDIPDRPLSRGQCGVSSVWVARELIEQGYDAQVAEGRFHTDGLDEPFVWVHVASKTRSGLIVDVTSDQFGSINGTKVHVGEYNSGPGSIGAYSLEECFDPYANAHRKLMRRYAILEDNIRSISWFRRKLLQLQ